MVYLRHIQINKIMIKEENTEKKKLAKYTDIKENYFTLLRFTRLFV